MIPSTKYFPLGISESSIAFRQGLRLSIIAVGHIWTVRIFVDESFLFGEGEGVFGCRAVDDGFDDLIP